MANISDYFSSGGGGGGITPTISFLGSQSWTPSYDMEAYVYVIGGGGSGCAGANSSDYLSGGGAGGCAISKLSLASGTAYTVTIGAGGAQVTTSSGYTVGNAGGNTSFSGSGISTMTGNGGSGGLRIQYETLGSGSGASGGTATGGTIANFTGGKGGQITSQLSSARSGGGAVGLWATGNDGADGIGTGSLNRFLAGGNPNYDLGTYTADEILNNHSYYGGDSAKSIPTISPFGMDVSAVEHHGMLPRGNYYSNSTVQYGIPQLRLSGAPHPYYTYYDAATHFAGTVAPAFHGGPGICSSQASIGGSASLGGGGGAGGIANGYTAAACYGGCGGTGAVIIFPLSIGS